MSSNDVHTVKQSIDNTPSNSNACIDKSNIVTLIFKKNITDVMDFLHIFTIERCWIDMPLFSNDASTFKMRFA